MKRTSDRAVVVTANRRAVGAFVGYINILHALARWESIVALLPLLPV